MNNKNLENNNNQEYIKTLEDLLSTIEKTPQKEWQYLDKFLSKKAGKDIYLTIVKMPLFKYNNIISSKGLNELGRLYKLIYEHVPMFQDERVQANFEDYSNKYNTIAAIYDENMKAINDICTFINKELYGILVDDEVDEIEKK